VQKQRHQRHKRHKLSGLGELRGSTMLFSFKMTSCAEASD
jgi:hypothetical protein